MADTTATRRRGYSDAYPTTGARRVTFTIDRIPPALWARVQGKAKRDGVSLRALVLGWCDEWSTDKRKGKR